MCQIDCSAIELKYQPKLRATIYSKKKAWDNYSLWVKSWRKLLPLRNTLEAKQAEEKIIRRILQSNNLTYIAGQLLFSYGSRIIEEVFNDEFISTRYMSLGAMWTGVAICHEAKDVLQHIGARESYVSMLDLLIHKEQYVSPEDSRYCRILFGEQWDEVPEACQGEAIRKWLNEPLNKGKNRP